LKNRNERRSLKRDDLRIKSVFDIKTIENKSIQIVKKIFFNSSPGYS